MSSGALNSGNLSFACGAGLMSWSIRKYSTVTIGAGLNAHESLAPESIRRYVRRRQICLHAGKAAYQHFYKTFSNRTVLWLFLLKRDGIFAKCGMRALIRIDDEEEMSPVGDMREDARSKIEFHYRVPVDLLNLTSLADPLEQGSVADEGKTE